MPGVVSAYLMPHAPILIPEIGGLRGKEATDTIEACKLVSEMVFSDNPGTIVLSSPHAPCFSDFTVISQGETLQGDLSHFGYEELSFSVKHNVKLSDEISDRVNKKGIPIGHLEPDMSKRYTGVQGLDHGATVPLYFILEAFKRKNSSFKIVYLSTPFLSSSKLYEIGKTVSEAAEFLNERVVYIGSGDLSHVLTKDAPAGFSPKGKIYDKKLVDLIKSNNQEGVLAITDEEMQTAAECGTKSFIMAFGSLDGKTLKTKVHSYEGPFGVGYICASLIPAAETKKESGAFTVENNKKDITGKDVYVRLAKETIETFILEGKSINPDEFLESNFPKIQMHEDFAKSAGVFVTLKTNNSLRGCIGTIQPTCKNVLEEIVQNAISAATSDPRFDPVAKYELEDIVYSVDVLGAPELIASKEQLDIKRYGVIVSKGFRKGLLLPDLEGVDTVDEQVDIALSKGGIDPNEDYVLQRFEVIRYS